MFSDISDKKNRLRHELSLLEMPRRPYMAHMTLTRSWRRLPLIRTLVHRPRLALCIGVTAMSMPLLHWLWPNHAVAEFLLSYNLGTILYLVLAGRMMLSSSVHHMRWRARLQDEGRTAVLMGVVVASVISLVAIAAQLSIAKDSVGITKILHIGLSAVTVLTSWSFTQTMFALHYAHTYYGPSSDSAEHGLDFPALPLLTTWIFFMLPVLSALRVKQLTSHFPLRPCGESDFYIRYYRSSTMRRW